VARQAAGQSHDALISQHKYYSDMACNTDAMKQHSGQLLTIFNDCEQLIARGQKTIRVAKLCNHVLKENGDER
jgi:hypothetical protein